MYESNTATSSLYPQSFHRGRNDSVSVILIHLAAYLTLAYPFY